MRTITSFALSAAAAALLAVGCQSQAHAQIGITIGAQPVCPYGYFDYSPYDCAPYGYYGPDWFNGGVFIGAGPWFHGDRGFYGHVDNRYDPHNGYHGPLPERGAQPFQHFQGNEARNGRGQVGHASHQANNEHQGGYRGMTAAGRGGAQHGNAGHENGGHH